MKTIVPSSGRSRCLAPAASLVILTTLVAGARADFITLDPPGSVSTDAFNVSGSNVVGTYTDASGRDHAFLYNGASYLTLDPAGSISSQAAQISSPSNVAGTYMDASGRDHAFLYNGRRSRPNAGLHCLCRLSLAHQAA
jgi:YD repeat-containing protein